MLFTRKLSPPRLGMIISHWKPVGISEASITAFEEPRVSLGYLCVLLKVVVALDYSRASFTEPSYDLAVARVRDATPITHILSNVNPFCFCGSLDICEIRPSAVGLIYQCIALYVHCIWRLRSLRELVVPSRFK